MHEPKVMQPKVIQMNEPKVFLMTWCQKCEGCIPMERGKKQKQEGRGRKSTSISKACGETKMTDVLALELLLVTIIFCPGRPMTGREISFLFLFATYMCVSGDEWRFEPICACFAVNL